jgi:phosphate transport system permease protein
MTGSAPTVQSPGGAGARPLPRGARRITAAARSAVRDGRPVAWIGGAAAVLPLLALGFVLAVLLGEAFPAIGYNGLHFLTGSGWNVGSAYANPVTTGGITHPPGASYGAMPLIVGTLATSAIALVIAVPVSIGAALVLVERLPRRLSSLVGLFLELLAGIPSVIIGLWGALTFGPFIARHIAPWIAGNAPDVPVLSYLKGSTGYGEGLLTSGLVLAVMVIPIVAATTRDLIRQVPVLPREGAVALGLSDFECARKVTLPWVGAGIVGAVVLGLGRALGETMAVAMVCGVALASVPSNLYDTMTTISATIVTQLDSSFTDGTGLETRALAEAGLVLMVITLLVNIGARLLVRRVSGTALPVGRGI